MAVHNEFLLIWISILLMKALNTEQAMTLPFPVYILLRYIYSLEIDTPQQETVFNELKELGIQRKH